MNFIVACFPNRIHDSGVVCSMFARYNPSVKKKNGQEKTSYLSEKQLQEAIKA